MNALKLVVRLFCIIPFLTGTADIINGVSFLSVAGAQLGSGASDPTLRSQVGFWGAIWLGFGVTLWRSSSHLGDEISVFRLLCGTIILSGLARLPPMVIFGPPVLPLLLAMLLEIVGGSLMLVWHRRLLSKAVTSTGLASSA